MSKTFNIKYELNQLVNKCDKVEQKLLSKNTTVTITLQQYLRNNNMYERALLAKDGTEDSDSYINDNYQSIIGEHDSWIQVRNNVVSNIQMFIRAMVVFAEMDDKSTYYKRCGNIEYLKIDSTSDDVENLIRGII